MTIKHSINLNSKHWMPFTANRDFKKTPRLMTSAEGIYYTNQNGDKIIDASSGLFNTPLGHCRPEIADAIQKQMLELDYIPHFNTGHPWAQKTGDQLAKILPKKFNRIFYVNSGSEAVDTAIKMIYAYWRAQGQGQKNILVSRELSYHGMNLGGVALSGMVNNRKFFNGSLPQVFHMRHTCLEENRFSRGIPALGGTEMANDLQRAINLHGADNIAACFIEPIAGGVGVLLPPTGYLEKLREICTKNNILLVFDEVITGFARTGEWFATDKFGVEPDIISMAKAITNGSVPMGAVATKQEIYDTVVQSADEKMIEFFHGYTTSAHPIACAACIATIDIMLIDKIDQRVQKLSKYFEDAIFQLQDLPVVNDIRNCGLLAGIELKAKNQPSLHGTDAYKKLFWEGLHIKATGDNLIVAPPYVSTEEEIDIMCGILRKVLSKIKD